MAALMLLTTTSAIAAERTISTGDELQLAISDHGTLEAVAIADKQLLPQNLKAFQPVSICDVTLGQEFVPVGGKATPESDGAVSLEGGPDRLSLTTTVRYEATNELIKIKLNLHDLSGKDRGLLVRFALPIDAKGWQWWDDMETARTIGDTNTYEHSKGIREFASLPEWRDKPTLKMGSHSVNFCNTITGPVGLCYVVPLDEPRIFRTGYDAVQRLFYIVYDVALTKETDPPSSAQMTFYLYRCDPKWGMRSALDRYYRLFGHFFTKHVRHDGMWMAFSKLSDIDNVNEFRFAFQEGAPEPGYDDRLDVDSLTYFTHAGQFARIPDYNPETDPEPSYERQLEAMRATFKRNTGSAEIFDASGLYDADGNLSIKRTAVYGHIIAQYNLDPHLPYGRHMLDRIPGVFKSYREKRGGRLDGFYYDGITTGINYRREHFKYANYPPIWDPVHKKPFLYNYFSSAEFAEKVADRLHTDGKITMMNGAMGSSFYTAPYLDVMGAETGLNINRTDFNYVRTICRHKPFVTLLKGNFSQLTGDDIALFMRRCVAYGVFPGYFDWPPSGLGPGSRYWDHAEWYERDRLNHRKYQALCQQLAAAGWEPLTLARGADTDLAVERFGQADKGEVFFTVLNDQASPTETVLTIPLSALPADPVVIDEAVPQWLSDATVKGNNLQVPLNLGPESLAVLHIASKQQIARSYAREIKNNLALCQHMRHIDQDRPELLVHWPKPRSGGYERADFDNRSCFKLTNTSNAPVQGATQWVMLYQETAEPLRLRLRLKCEDVDTKDRGRLGIDALLCHVNMKTRFTERKLEKYELDPGTYDWKDKEIIITPERPLRSIQLSINLSRCTGTVWVDEISITPVEQPDQEYVVDPALDQWYDRPTSDEMAMANQATEQLQQDADQLLKATPDNLTPACLSLLTNAVRAETRFREKNLDNPCRRELREFDDMATKLSILGSLLTGVRGPIVDAPHAIVPGEKTAVRIRVQGAANSPVQFGLETPPQWRSEAADDGRFLVTAPAEALGTTGQLTATASVELSPGLALPLRTSKTLQVVRTVEADMKLRDISGAGDRFDFAVNVSNNSQKAMPATLKTQLPKGWQVQGLLPNFEMKPGSKRQIDFSVIPPAGAKPGQHEIHARLSSPHLTQPRDFTHSVLFVPQSLNRLKNPGFEDGPTGWSRNEGTSEIDTSHAHDGKASIRLSNQSPSQNTSVSQTITLNQKTPQPISVRGHAKAENVSGHPGKGFCIYVDIYYTDGTPLYGQTINWQTGTTDWQHGEMTIRPTKPIRNVNVYLLLRRKSGTAWFDDLTVAENVASD